MAWNRLDITGNVYKRDFCLTNGIQLIEISYTDKNNLENIILSIINEHERK